MLALKPGKIIRVAKMFKELVDKICWDRGIDQSWQLFKNTALRAKE